MGSSSKVNIRDLGITDLNINNTVGTTGIKACGEDDAQGHSKKQEAPAFRQW